MATTPDIRVFVMFPLEPAVDPQSSKWDWVHCLTFPLDVLNKVQFALKLYKWIRYATGVVIGAQGDLSFSRDSPDDVFGYDHDPPFESADLYYHVSEAERRRMFPADPNMGRTSITSSDATSRRLNFRNDIVGRDGVCVVTGYRKHFCHAAHLLPHSKGDNYIKAYTQRRSRDPAGNDVVCDIDDVRNGILLNTIAHRSLGVDIAFLITPNFAMSTADVDPSALPSQKRCTAHLFDPDQPESFGNPLISSGSPVRISDTAWPPSILFDAVYADAVLCHFAAQAIRDALERWKSTFYPSGITNTTQASYQAIVDERAAEAERKDKQNQEREQRATRRADRTGRPGDDLDFYDCLMILPYLMIPPEKQEEAWRKAEEQRAEMERSRLGDTITGWARGVANAC